MSMSDNNDNSVTPTKNGISLITDFKEYIEAVKKLKDENILFLAAVRDTPGIHFKDEYVQLWKELGFRCSLKDKHWCGYIAVTDFKELYFEKLGNKDETVEVTMDAAPGTQIKLLSSPYRGKNRAEIKINGEEFSDNFRGLNLVVYDMENKCVIDTVSFDTHVSKTGCSKKYAIHPVKDVRERLKIANFLPVEDLNSLKETETFEISNDKPVEVRICFYGFAGIWNSLRSIALAFAKDKRFHVVVVISYDTDGHLKKQKVVAEDGLEVVDTRDYRIENDNADIWITNAWHSNVFKHLDFRKNGKLLVIASSALVNGGLPQEEVRDHFVKFSKVSDYVLVEKVVYNDLKDAGMLSENIVQMGNPKFDSIYDKVSSKEEIKGEWEKLKGKKIILWTTDHVWDTNNVTFDLYAKDVLKYFQEHTEMGLVVRPHNMYIRELGYEKIWSKEDLNMIRQFFKNSPNMIWDETPDYATSYRMADAVIADVNCGITVSALVLDKPLAVLYRDDGNVCIPKNDEFASNLYELKNFEDLKSFFKMVADGKDDKREDRHRLFEKYISYFDGKNGERIKQFIETKYDERVNFIGDKCLWVKEN